MPSTSRRSSKLRVHRRVAAATLATFALALGAVTFAGSPLPKDTSSGARTTATPAATTTSAGADTASADTVATATSTVQPASSTSPGQTSSATLTTTTS